MQIKLFTIRLDADCLEIDQNSLNDFLGTINFKKSDTHFVEADENYWSVMVHYEEQSDSQTEEINKPVEMNEEEKVLFQNLKKWRSEKAVELGFKSFMVCYDSELFNIVVRKPKSIEELKTIKGFSNVKSQKYGDDIISLLKTA